MFFVYISGGCSCTLVFEGFEERDRRLDNSLCLPFLRRRGREGVISRAAAAGCKDVARIVGVVSQRLRKIVV